MNVKLLIEELQKLPQESDVLIKSSYDNLYDEAEETLTPINCVEKVIITKNHKEKMSYKNSYKIKDIIVVIE